MDARAAGYREAVADCESWTLEARFAGSNRMIGRRSRTSWTRLRPDGFVCANDFTAAHSAADSHDLGVNVPDDVRMVGIDDVKYASLLSVPLTTIHQPCASMGAIAIGAMLDRLARTQTPGARHPVELRAGGHGTRAGPDEEKEKEIDSHTPNPDTSVA